MLVKTQPRSGIHIDNSSSSRQWITKIGSGNKVFSTLLTSRDNYNNGGLSESAAVVYYQCRSLEDQESVQPKMRGARRVITFCILTACIPVILLILPIYLRKTVFAERNYTLNKHDVMSLHDGISSCFCQRQTITGMQGNFSAYLLLSEPTISNNFINSVTESQMIIPDDRLEYWGFNLLPGSIITLAVCASTPGARLLVVRGESNLELCGLLNHQSVDNPTTPDPVVRDEDKVQILIQEKTKSITTKTVTDQYEDENKGEEITDPPDNNDTITHHTIKNKLIRNTRELNNKGEIIHFEGGIIHGGNTNNFTIHGLLDEEADEGSSLSSFETELINCFSGKTLFKQGFPPGRELCTNNNWTTSLSFRLTVKAHGHIYYVFYSDNDLESNTINARFTMNATTYNFSHALNHCINVTNCSFDLSFFDSATLYIQPLSDPLIIVSTCEPRYAVYLLFPLFALICVLIFGLL